MDRAVRALCAALHSGRGVRVSALGDVRRRVDCRGFPFVGQLHAQRHACGAGLRMSDFHPNAKGGFIENTLEGLHYALQRALYAETSASRAGVLQRLDPRVKVAGLFALVVTVALVTKLWLIAAILAIAVGLALLSSIPIGILAART